MAKVFQFPSSQGLVWREVEAFLLTQVFPQWSVRHDEEAELLSRLKSHWEWVFVGPASFTLEMPMPPEVSDEDAAELRQAVVAHSQTLMDNWQASVKSSMIELAKVNHALMRSIAGEPPPFD